MNHHNIFSHNSPKLFSYDRLFFSNKGRPQMNLTGIMQTTRSQMQGGHVWFMCDSWRNQTNLGKEKPISGDWSLT